MGNYRAFKAFNVLQVAGSSNIHFLRLDMSAKTSMECKIQHFPVSMSSSRHSQPQTLQYVVYTGSINIYYIYNILRQHYVYIYIQLNIHTVMHPHLQQVTGIPEALHENIQGLPRNIIEIPYIDSTYFIVSPYYPSNGGFLKWGYPQSSPIYRIFHDINQPAMGVPPFLWNPPIFSQLHMFDFRRRTRVPAL